MGKPVSGIIRLKVNGASLECAAFNFTYNTNPFRKEYIEGTDGEYRLVKQKRFVKGTILVTAKTNRKAVAEATDIPVEFDTGVRSIVAKAATNMESGETEANESTMNVEFVGPFDEFPN